MSASYKIVDVMLQEEKGNKMDGNEVQTHTSKRLSS